MVYNVENDSGDGLSMLLTKNIIERPISVKHLTPPPFQGRRSKVAVGVEEATAAGISTTLGRAHQARLPVGRRWTDAGCQRYRRRRVPQQEGVLDRPLPREYTYKTIYTAPHKQIYLQRRQQPNK